MQKFGYGLDEAGWIAARFTQNDEVPIDLLGEWIDESYESVAPKKRAVAAKKRAAKKPAAG